MGLASFGKSGLVKTAFDGPGGTGGTCVAVQSIGSAFRKLQAGRLVYLDIPAVWMVIILIKQWCIIMEI